MYKEKKYKSKNGITLVALVITVIVLLILAGVAITAIVGADGMFSKTRTAAEKYNNATKDESKSIENMMDELKRHSIKFKLSSSNIKRTSFELSVETIANYDNEITQYEYFINGESKQKINGKTFKFENLRAETDYSVYVKAYDTSDNSYQTDTIIVRTEDRTNLVKSGSNIGVTINLRSTAGIQNEFRADCVYMRSASVAGDGNSGYQSCQSSSLINVTEYSKLYMKAKGHTIADNPIALGLKQTNDWMMGTNQMLLYLEDTEKIYEYDISNITGDYYAYANCYNGHSGTYTEIQIYDMWLE